jgi:hypothetical protein
MLGVVRRKEHVEIRVVRRPGGKFHDQQRTMNRQRQQDDCR